MKKLITIIVLIFITVTVFSQESTSKNEQEMKTLFGGSDISHGGYGAIMFNYTQIDGKDAFLVGGRGAWVINHGIAIGMGGYGFANDLSYNFPYNGIANEKFSLAGGYGGLIIEPIIAPFYPVHVSIPVLIGAGGVSYVNNYWDVHNDDHNFDYKYNYTLDAAAFFVVEPGVEIEFNIVKFMRISLGAYYRYTSKIGMIYTADNVLNGFSTGISLKFGKF